MGEQLVWGTAGLITIAALYVGYVVYNAPPKLMPTFQVESVEASRGELVYRENSCSACHKVWHLGGRHGGALDGVGSRRSAEWLTTYLSAKNPQVILPSTEKKIYRMPSFASLAEDQRIDLVAYLISLKQHTPEELAAPPVSGNGAEGTPGDAGR